MSRKRKPARAAAAQPVRRRARLATALVVGIGLSTLLLGTRYGLFGGQPEVPDPDRSAMEPQVAAKIVDARVGVLEAPDSHEAWGRLGMVLHAHALEGDAASCYRKAAELAPSDFRWRYLLAHALRDSDPAAAIAEAESASRLRPEYAPAYVFRAQLLETSNRLDEAIEAYRKAVELEADNTMAHFGLGRLYLGRGETESALRHLLRARELGEGASAIHGALAQAYRQTGDMESALRENRLASQSTEAIAITDPVHYSMRKESVSSVALLERAIEADRALDFETALKLYQELSALRPDDANIRTRFGDVLARQSKLGEAKAQYEAALEADPRQAAAHYGLGNVLNFEGDYDGAARHYRAALETRPEHASTLLNLAGILAFRGELPEAEEMCRRALELDPKSFAANLHLGRVLLQRDSYREAVAVLRTAVEARPDSGPAHRQLSVALAGVGEYGEAWEHLERALALGEKVPPNLVEELKRRAGRG